MGAPGKSGVVEGGKRGVLAGNKSAAYNAEESCPACCVEFSQTWSFTDQGFIDGGQNEAYRAYDDPADVPASPWTILNGGLDLRLDWEDDKNCRSHNPNTQSATATAEIIVPRDTLMTVRWSGMGETQDPEYELMSLYVDGNFVGSAHAPGGKLGCAGGMPCSRMKRLIRSSVSRCRGVSCVNLCRDTRPPPRWAVTGVHPEGRDRAEHQM